MYTERSRDSQLGQLGSDYISNNTARTGTWVAITALADTVFTTLTTDSVKVNGTAPNPTNNLAITLLKGMTIYGRFTAITLDTTSGGACMAYN